MNCHTVEGYRSMRRLMHGRDRKSITNIVTMLHESPFTSPYRNFMPRPVGTKEEINALIGYLVPSRYRHTTARRSNIPASEYGTRNSIRGRHCEPRDFEDSLERISSQIQICHLFSFRPSATSTLGYHSRRVRVPEFPQEAIQARNSYWLWIVKYG